MRNLILAIMVLGIAVYLGMKYAKRDTFEAGFYHNREVGFSLDFPEYWSEVDAKEVLGGFGLALEFTDIDTRLFVTPSNPEEAIFIITQIRGNEDRISQLSLDDVLAHFSRQGMTVDLKKADSVDGIDVFRGAGSNKAQYMHVAMFGIGDTMVQFQFHAPTPVDRTVQQDVTRIMTSLSIM